MGARVSATPSASGTEIPAGIGRGIPWSSRPPTTATRRSCDFPRQPNTRAVERFTRVGDDVIDYQFTINDPTVYTRPWTAVRPMTGLPDYRIYEYACHEGNYALSGILAGARAEEKAAEEAAKKESGAR